MGSILLFTVHLYLIIAAVVVVLLLLYWSKPMAVIGGEKIGVVESKYFRLPRVNTPNDWEFCSQKP